MIPNMAPEIGAMLDRYAGQPIQRSMDRHPSQINGDTPGDWVRANLRWDDYLVKHRWSPVKGKYWCRPNKDPRDGHSAQLHDDGRLAIWTGEVPNEIAALGSRQIDGGISISLYDFIAAYEFGGDRQALGGYVRLRLMPPPPPAGGTTAAEADGEPSADALGATPNSWTEDVDVLAALEGRSTAPETTIMQRTDGVSLFYPGTMGLVYGDSDRGKGWVCCVALAQEISLGHNVMYLDMEDTVASINSRLRIIGLADDQIARHLTYRHPSDPADQEAVDALIVTCKERAITLIVIDSLGEAFALDGINENNDAEVGPWISRVARRIAWRTGATVILVDHATKSQEIKLHPSGSKRKRAAVDVAYLIEPLRMLVKGKGGALKMITAKDKHGTHPSGRPAAIVNFIPSGDGMRYVISPVTEDQFQPESQVENQTRQVTERQMEVLGMARKYEADNRGKPWSCNRLANYAGGNAKTTKEAITRLIEHGHFLEAGKYKNSLVYLVSEGAPLTRFDP